MWHRKRILVLVTAGWVLACAAVSYRPLPMRGTDPVPDQRLDSIIGADQIMTDNGPTSCSDASRGYNQTTTCTISNVGTVCISCDDENSYDLGS